MIGDGGFNLNYPDNRYFLYILCLLAAALVLTGFLIVTETHRPENVHPSGTRYPAGASTGDSFPDRFMDCSDMDCFRQINLLLTSLKLDTVIRDIAPLPDKQVSVFHVSSVRFRVSPVEPAMLSRLTTALENPDLCFRIASFSIERLSDAGNALDLSITVQCWRRRSTKGTGRTRDNREPRSVPSGDSS